MKPIAPALHRRLRALRVGLAALALVALAAPAGAGTIHVFPDAGGTPVADALAQLQGGDRLILNAGTYTERLTLVDLAKVKVLAKGEVVFDAVGPSASISVTNCEQIQLSGLTVRDAPTQGLLVAGSDKVVIRDCVVEGHGTQGLAIGDSTGVKVTKCTFTGGANGIQVSGASVVRVVANMVIDPLGQGILMVVVSLPGSKLVRNEVRGAGNAGIVLDGPGNLAQRNTIDDCLFGIVTPSGGDPMPGSAIVRNTLTNTLVALRAYLAGGVVFKANAVVDATASALQIASSAEDVEVSRNTVQGANSGIDDEGSGSRVLRNRLADTLSYGIRARGEGGTFERNEVADTPADGFHVWTGGNVFRRNRATGNAGTDLTSQVAEGENTFEKNAFDTTSFPG